MCLISTSFFLTERALNHTISSSPLGLKLLGLMIIDNTVWGEGGGGGGLLLL